MFNLFTLSASVSYALDVFGGEQRTVEGLSTPPVRGLGRRLVERGRGSGQSLMTNTVAGA